MKCPCGEDHPELADLLQRLALLPDEHYGEEGILVSYPSGSAWLVPRIYIAAHGLRAQELPALAEKYGWPRR